MLCYRVKTWSFKREQGQLRVLLSCTTHPANTSLRTVIRRSFSGSATTVGESGKFSAGTRVYFLGLDGDLVIRGDIPPEDELDALFTLLSKVVSISDACDVTVCVDVYRTPVEGLPYYEWPFTQVGKLLSAAKYEGSRDASMQIAKILHNVAINHPALRSAEGIASMPPHEMTVRRDDPPEQWARLLCEWLSVPYVELTRTRSVAKQRDVMDAEEARRNQAFSMAAADSAMGLAILVIDDFYTDGDTMSEAVRSLRVAGATCVMGLCAAKTAKGGLHGVA